MRSQAALRARQDRREALKAEANRVLDHLVSFPGISHSAARRDLAQQVLLQTDGQMMANGQLWEISCKPLGAGVYRLQLKERA